MVPRSPTEAVVKELVQIQIARFDEMGYQVQVRNVRQTWGLCSGYD